ncbi:IclR family transcriptional regulator C-terminal domain-containing protein [Ligilactobacillus faecis]|nr:IclR family transcriptional regulator C-terminal domain-containing protein [Ligilactobacillus faecis]WGN90142.1 IclR family transcriptional regulator C-terminal domain-containing protein [Ligilactobacillus faecis]
MIFNEQIVISQVIPTASHLVDQKRLGESLPLNTTTMGKCALAFLEPQQQVYKKC